MHVFWEASFTWAYRPRKHLTWSCTSISLSWHIPRYWVCLKHGDPPVYAVFRILLLNIDLCWTSVEGSVCPSVVFPSVSVWEATEAGCCFLQNKQILQSMKSNYNGSKEWSRGSNRFHCHFSLKLTPAMELPLFLLDAEPCCLVVSAAAEPTAAAFEKLQHG